MLKGSDARAMGSAFSGLVYTMCGFAGRVGQIVGIIWEHCLLKGDPKGRGLKEKRVHQG